MKPNASIHLACCWSPLLRPPLPLTRCQCGTTPRRRKPLSLVRAADVFRALFRARPHQGLGPQAPGVEDPGVLRLAAQGRAEGGDGRRREGAAASDDGHSHGYDKRRVQRGRQRLDRHRPSSQDRPAADRNDLPADEGTAGLPACQRLQDLHRLRWRHRVHAAWAESCTACRRSR